MNRKAHIGLSILLIAVPILLAACGGGGGGGGVVQPPGQQAVDVLWVVPDNTIASSTVIAAFAADNLYYNAHTTDNPDGEIRGQIDAGGTVKFATLEGAQEAPNPVATNAFGGGVLSVDDVTGRVRGFVVTSGLVNANLAHIHGPAGRGEVASPIVQLEGGPDIWVVPDNAILTPAQVAAFAADNLYFNVHTPAPGGFPDGEIRGQIDKGGTVKFATLDGAQETPSVTTSAFGGGALSLDGSTNRAGGFIVTSGLVDPLFAHVHGPAARDDVATPVVSLLPP